MPAPARVCRRRLDLRLHAPCCATGLCTASRAQPAKHGLILLPHELDLQRQEFEGWDGGAVVNPTAANNHGLISRYSRILRRSKPKPPRPKLAQPLWVCQTSTTACNSAFSGRPGVCKGRKVGGFAGRVRTRFGSFLGQRIDGGCVSSEQQPKRLMTYEPFRGNAGVCFFFLVSIYS